MKIANFKNGAYVSLEYGPLNTVKVYTPSGNFHDKIRCDTRSQANDYFRAFKAIAKNF